MVEGRVIEAINFIEKRLEEQGINVSKIILFGSHAKGTAAPDSDIDLIIVSDDFVGKDLFERAQMTKEAEIAAIKKFMLPFDILTKIDILTKTGAELENEDSLIADFAKEGECVYGG